VNVGGFQLGGPPAIPQTCSFGSTAAPAFPGGSVSFRGTSVPLHPPPPQDMSEENIECSKEMPQNSNKGPNPFAGFSFDGNAGFGNPNDKAEMGEEFCFSNPGPIRGFDFGPIESPAPQAPAASVEEPMSTPNVEDPKDEKEREPLVPEEDPGTSINVFSDVSVGVRVFVVDNGRWVRGAVTRVGRRFVTIHVEVGEGVTKTIRDTTQIRLA
jgi:hypothetical protein